MIIHSEQEMLDFGTNVAKDLLENVASAGGRAGGSPAARSRTASTVGETARSGPAKATIIELIGDVGVGKTTFTRGLAKGLGIKEPITSPSFTISKTYALPNGGNLIHYDFYRLDDPGIMSEDLKENLKDNKNIIVIEWGESVSNLLPNNTIVLLFEKEENDFRIVSIKNNRNNTFRDISRPTGSELARSPVTTGATKRVEKGVVRLYLDTSTPETILRLNDKEYKHVFGKALAEKLLQFIHDKLQENDQDWHDITDISFMSGPGSFTGLRIGASIVNTLAHELNIPLKDHHGKTHKQIIPNYGRPANISKPVK